MAQSDLLLEMKDIHIEGLSDETWTPIIKGVNLDLKRGEVLGLIGESGAGKSTLGLAAMGFTRDGCKISQGTVNFDGMDLRNATAQQKRELLGKRIASCGPIGSRKLQSGTSHHRSAHRGPGSARCLF